MKPVLERLENTADALELAEAQVARLTRARNALIVEARSGEKPPSLRVVAARAKVSPTWVANLTATPG